MIYLTHTVAKVTKMAAEIDLDLTKFKAFGRTAKYQNLKYFVCRDSSHNLLKYLFAICLCSMLNSLSNISNLLQNGLFPIVNLLFVAIFVTIATVKVKLKTDLFGLLF